MQLRNIIVGVSLAALTSSVAMAKGMKKEPNCDVAGKKVHVKDEAACTKKHGTWVTVAAEPAAAAPAAAEAPAAGEAHPAEGHPADHK